MIIKQLHNQFLLVATVIDNASLKTFIGLCPEKGTDHHTALTALSIASHSTFPSSSLGSLHSAFDRAVFLITQHLGSSS